MDSEGRGVERFQSSFCSLFCSYHLMVVATADPICTSSPILPISQPVSFPFLPTSHRIACIEPTPFSPSPLITSLHNTQYKAPNVPYLPLLLFDSTSILEREEVIEMRHKEMIPWTPEFATSVAGRCGTLRVMISGGDCACFDLVVLNAYKECPAQDQEDRRRHLRRRRRFQSSLCILT